MATKKINWKEKTDAELAKLLLETRENMRTHRYEAAGSRPKNPNAGKAGKQTIARVLTEMTTRKNHGK